MADLFGGLDGRTDDAGTLAALEVDYTPPAVALQLLLALQRALEDIDPDWRVRRALDPAAGSGCFGRAVRALVPDAHLTGIEARSSEAHNLTAAYDVPIVGDGLESAMSLRRFDLIISNPPFSAFGAKDREKRVRFWPSEFRRRELVAEGGIVAFLGLSQWGQGAEARRWLDDWCPVLQIRAGGRIEFRGEGTQRRVAIPKSRRVPGGPTHEMRDNGADSREHSLWVWSACYGIGARRRRAWETEQLPVLPASLRCWSPSAVPGTYPLDADLVAEVRRYL